MWLALEAPLAAQALVNGGVANGSIAVAGEVDSYSFSATTGQGLQIRVADLTLTGFFPRIELRGPTGTSIASGQGQDVGAISVSAPSSGTYTLLVSDGLSGGVETGDYEVYFTLAPGANEGGALANGHDVVDAIDPGDLDSYTFSANVGETIWLRVVDLDEGSLQPRIDLYGPNGGTLASGQGATVGSIALAAAATGTYTVVVSDASAAFDRAGLYALYFVRVPGAAENGVLPNGGLVGHAIDVGDLDSFTFAANAGHGIHLRVSDFLASPFLPRIDLYGPGGAAVATGQGSLVGAIDVIAPSTGTYTVVVSDASSSLAESGVYDVYFARAPGAAERGTLINGTSAFDSIDQGDLDSYMLEASAGNLVQVRVADVSATNFVPRLELHGPSGALLASNQHGQVAEILTTLATSGTHTLIVSDGSSGRANFGDYDLYFVRIPGADEGGLLENGSVVLDTIDPGDLDSFTFSASSGQTAMITVTNSSGGSFVPRITLYGNTGTALAAIQGASSATLNHAISITGTYTVVISDGSASRDQSGDYSIVVNGIGNPPTAVPTPAWSSLALVPLLFGLALRRLRS